MLPAGAIIVFLLSGLLKGRYDDSGFGSFHGSLTTKLGYFGLDRSVGVHIEGRSPARWHWFRPDNYQYPLLSFSWSGEAGDRSGQIETASMTLRVSDHSVPVSPKSLSELLFGAPLAALRPEEVKAVDCIQGMIEDAALGRLPPPRHHGYHFEKPLSGTMIYSSAGSRYPYSLYWWAGLWAIICLWFMLGRRRAKTNGEPSNAPNRRQPAGIRTGREIPMSDSLPTFPDSRRRSVT